MHNFVCKNYQQKYSNRCSGKGFMPYYFFNMQTYKILELSTFVCVKKCRIPPTHESIK